MDISPFTKFSVKKCDLMSATIVTTLESYRWKCQRKFTLDFMRKFGMSKFKSDGTSKVESKIMSCIEEFMSS